MCRDLKSSLDMRTIRNRFRVSSELTIHLRFFSNKSAMCVPELVCMDDSDCVLFHLASRTLGANPDLAEWERVQNYAPFVQDSCKGIIEFAVEYDGILRGIDGKHVKGNTRPYTLRLGVPESIVAKPGRHDIVIRLSTKKAQFFFDGVLVDEDAVTGHPVNATGHVLIDDSRFPNTNESATDHTIPVAHAWNRALSNTEIHDLSGGTNIIPQRKVEIFGPREHCLQYWTPPGHNWWVGDTMCFYHEGRFHLFWLNARRHHSGKSGAGGHWFEHCSTTDMKHWTHHPPAVDIEEQWEEFGTGNCLYHDGLYHLFYGMHTSRLVPESATCVRTFRNARENNVPSDPVSFGAGGKLPSGTAVATSEDGIHFRKTRINIHEAENPFVFHDATTGLFHMIGGYGARGRFVSEDLAHWQWADPTFYPLKEQTPAGNSGECMCLFEWNKWWYLMGGRTGFWMSRNLKGPFWHRPDTDSKVIEPAWSIYDGLQLPEVAAFLNNRRILVGNLPAFGYGGTLVFRELVQHDDGNLGTKWPEEMIPAHLPALTPEIISITKCNHAGADQLHLKSSGTAFGRFRLPSPDLMITMQADCAPGTEAFGLCVVGKNTSEEDLEIRLEPRRKRVQFSVSVGEKPAEDAPLGPDAEGHLTDRTCFAITGVTGLNKPCRLALILKHEPKSRSTIVDLCIDNRRTLITRRRNLSGIELRVFVRNGAVTFSDIRTAPLL